MSTAKEEKKIVADLNRTMLMKLRKNRHKSPWHMEAHADLLIRIREELTELASAVDDMHESHTALNAYAIMEECADVANFCAMLHANCLNHHRFLVEHAQKIRRRRWRRRKRMKAGGK